MTTVLQQVVLNAVGDKWGQSLCPNCGSDGLTAGSNFFQVELLDRGRVSLATVMGPA